MAMRLTLLESDRSLLRSSELITLSVAVHAAVVGLVALTEGLAYHVLIDAWPADEAARQVEAGIAALYEPA